MKVGLIYQPCGLGDILFIQKLAAQMLDGGNQEVYWPVVHELAWLDEYIPWFNFVSWEDHNKITGPPLPDHVEFPHKDVYSPDTPTHETADLNFFQGFANVSPVMAGKYDSVDLDWRDWRKWISYLDYPAKEEELFYNVLGLDDDDEYVFVNRNYMLRPEVKTHPSIPERFDAPVVEMSIIPGFTMFDWGKVIAGARSIYMVETALNYMLECPAMFDAVKDKELVLYHRNNNFSEVEYLFDLPWRYVT